MGRALLFSIQHTHSELRQSSYRLVRRRSKVLATCRRYHHSGRLRAELGYLFLVNGTCVPGRWEQRLFGRQWWRWRRLVAAGHTGWRFSRYGMRVCHSAIQLLLAEPVNDSTTRLLYADRELQLVMGSVLDAYVDVVVGLAYELLFKTALPCL